MNRAEDQLGLLGSLIFCLKFGTFFEKVAFYDTYSAVPEPWIQICDLGLRVQEIISCPLHFFWAHQCCSESSEKVAVRYTVCPWVHMASTAVESFLFRPWAALSFGVTRGRKAPLLLLFKQGLWHLILRSCSCNYGFQVKFFAGEYSTSWWK